MKLLKKLEKLVQKSTKMDYYKKMRRVQKRKTDFENFLLSREANHDEVFKVFDSMMENIFEEIGTQFRVISKVPLLVSIFDILLTHLDFKEYFSDDIERYHIFFILCTFLKEPDQLYFESMQEYTRFVTSHQVVFLNEGFDGKREEFVLATMRGLLNATQFILYDIGIMESFVIRIAVQWFDAMMALSIDNAISVIENWSSHVIALNGGNKKDIPISHSTLFRSQLDLVSNFYGKSLSMLFRMKTEESKKAMSEIMDFFHNILKSNYEIDGKYVAATVKVFAVVFASSRIDEIELIVLSLLLEDPRYEVRLSCLYVTWHCMFKIARRGDERNWNKRKHRWFSKVLRSARCDPSSNVRYRAIRLLLGYPFDEGEIAEIDDDSFRYPYSFFGDFDNFKKFVVLKSKDLDDKSRLLVFEWVMDHLNDEETENIKIDSKKESNEFEKVKNPKLKQEDVLMIVLLSVDDPSKKVRNIGKKILKKMFQERLVVSKETDEVVPTRNEKLLDLLKKMNITEMMRIKDILEEFIDDIMDKMLIVDDYASDNKESEENTEEDDFGFGSNMKINDLRKKLRSGEDVDLI